jgi:membrane protein DedA with SNARE-associated domain
VLLLASLTSHVGYLALIALVAVESSGVPVPGETALIAAGVLASDGSLSIELVIAFAAMAAIIGDNIGYQLGRRYGRRVLLRGGRLEAQRARMLSGAESFFDRHGPKAVFLGRWVTGLRVWAAWLAGATHMRWRVFLAWNALGGLAWALSIGLLAYFFGRAAARVIEHIGQGAAVLVGVAVIVLVIALRYRSRDG